MLTKIWFLLKFVLSIIIVLFGVLFFLITISKEGLASGFAWGVMAFSLFIATAPWVFVKNKFTLSFELSGVFVGIFLIYFGSIIEYVPKDCEGHVICKMVRFLYENNSFWVINLFFITIGLYSILRNSVKIMNRINMHNKRLWRQPKK